MAKNEGKVGGDSEQRRSQVASSVSAKKSATTDAEGKRGDTVTKRSGGPKELPPRFGRYRVIQKLGGGGMGSVYLVENTELEREEALKVPHFGDGDDPQLRERFLREAKSAAKLDHANLCPVYDAGVQDGIYYLTMRFLKGKLLSDYVGRAQPARKAVETVTKLTQALEAAHAKGVIHRDLKPSNVMMVSGTGPVVMDFGLAKQVRQVDTTLTQAGSTLGTPAYMPPEQVKGELDRMGPASDVYSLGVILYELLTGRLPFEGRTEAMIYGQILYTEPPLPSALVPELDPTLDEICRKAMAKEPRERYSSMKAFAAALLDYLRQSPATEGAGNLMPTTVDDAAVFRASTQSPGRQPAGNASIFRAQTVAPDAATASTTDEPWERMPSLPSWIRSKKPGNSPQPVKAEDDEPVQSSFGSGALIAGGVAVVLVAASIGLWASGILRVRTAEGTLVVEVNEPNPEVYVDGEKVTVTWENGGVKAEVAVQPGTRRVELKKDGFRVYGREVTLEGHDRTLLHARLEPLESITPPPTAPAPRVGNATPRDSGAIARANIPADAQAFNGHFYKFIDENIFWKEAKQKCEALGGHLLIVENLDENAFAAKLVADAKWEDAWIGATDEAKEGDWRTVKGDPLPFTNWFTQQPNNKPPGEHWVLISNKQVGNESIGWKWCDQPNQSMDHKPGYLCEWDGGPAANGGSPELIVGSPVTAPREQAPNAEPPAPLPSEPPGQNNSQPESPEPERLGDNSAKGSRAGEVRADNALKMKFCWCPPGTLPGFWAGKYEVTQSEWATLMGKMPSAPMNKGQGDRFPIYSVSLDEAIGFCRKLTDLERDAGRLPAGWEYRVPTEPEWEYACRAGTTTATAFGDKLSSTQANFNGDWPHGGAPKGPNIFHAVKVGSYRPNAWGIHDMHGNVKEFTTTPGHVRGGSWFDSGRNCCSEIWIPDPPSPLESLGFRVVLVPSNEPIGARPKALRPRTPKKLNEIASAPGGAPALDGIVTKAPEASGNPAPPDDSERPTGAENDAGKTTLATRDVSPDDPARKSGGMLESSVESYRKQVEKANRELLTEFDNAAKKLARPAGKRNQSTDVLAGSEGPERRLGGHVRPLSRRQDV